jgi:hypothetical protein
MDAPSDFRDVLRRSPSRQCRERADIALTEMGHEVTVQVVARGLTPAKRAVTKVRQAKSSVA